MANKLGKFTLKLACKKLADFLVRKHIKVETDHQPLVPLLGAKRPDRLSLTTYMYHKVSLLLIITRKQGNKLSLEEALKKIEKQPSLNP